jgi:hypothetical protein
MTNAADKMSSNIHIMNQLTPLHRTLTNAGLRRENIGQILQSRDDLLKVIAPGLRLDEGGVILVNLL